MASITGFGEFAEELDDFADALDDAADDLDAAVDTGIKRTIRDIEATIKRLAPVDTGTLRHSYQWSRLGRHRYAVGTDVDYGPDVEYGTAPHLITPNGDGPLTFPVDDGWVSTYEVEHPGTPAQPHVRPALEQHRSDLVENIAEEIDDVLAEYL